MNSAPRSEIVRSRCFDAFEREFVRSPEILVRAPGRVNLIGEHTDYTQGLVLPCAIDREIWVAVAARSDSRVRAHAVDFRGDASADSGQTLEFMMDGVHPSGGFDDYVCGVIAALLEADVQIAGCDIAIASDLPMGAGLSSSAALCVALCHGMLATQGLTPDARDVARLAHRAESHFVGVQCGILDQFAVALGSRDHALRIDCRSQESEPVPFPGREISILISDSGVERKLAAGSGEQDAGTGYRERVAQCTAALAAVVEMSDEFAHAQSLRDVEADWLPSLEPEMDPVVFRRLRHVVRENERVDACVAALSRAAGPDLEAVGDILNAGHASLRDDYEVSILELDVLCEEANRVDGVYGSRMTGAGFGGSALHLVRSDAVVPAREEIGARFRARFGRTPTMLIVKASDGATVESPSRS